MTLILPLLHAAGFYISKSLPISAIVSRQDAYGKKKMAPFLLDGQGKIFSYYIGHSYFRPAISLVTPPHRHHLNNIFILSFSSSCGFAFILPYFSVKLPAGDINARKQILIYIISIDFPISDIVNFGAILSCHLYRFIAI